MDLSRLLLFALSSLLLMLTPGPDMIPVVTRGVGQGRRAAFLTVFGYGLADITHALFAAIGLSSLLLTSAFAFKLIKYVGAAYFIYLGIRMLLKQSNFLFESGPVALAPRNLLWQGYLSNLLNPEATLFFLAFLPQFVDISEGKVALQIMVLGLIFTLIGQFVYCVIAYFSGSVGLWLSSRRWIADRLRYFAGSIFIVFGIQIAVKEEV
jgi:threonine/homoserine/homoserine lactone efflux protein